jgi:hypothetical protein
MLEFIDWVIGVERWGCIIMGFRLTVQVDKSGRARDHLVCRGH